jgi:signal transduction histidine kinase
VPLQRSTDEPLLGGVAAGLAVKTGVDVTVVRVVFVLSSLASGFGVAAYVVGWLLLPAAGQERTIASRALGDRRGLSLAAGVAALLAVLLLISSALGASWLGSLTWPLTIGAAGLALVWRNASEEEQARLHRIAEPALQLVGGTGGRRLRLRFAAGVVLLGAGLGALLVGRPNSATLRPLGGLLLVIAAFVVALGPWWLRIARDLMLERQARARAEERADIAARVHDSVLQTLALIQRRADEPHQVVQLARAQERELRAWLFGGPPPGLLGEEATTLAAGVQAIQQEVESVHGLPVETVVVGDCDLDEPLHALLAAAREATVNAAKWSGAPSISVFAEATPEQVSVFVRDRGVGFDPDAVPADRKGVAESIRGRMSRHGGSAEVVTAPGNGTEVRLTMPRVTARA